MLAAYLLVAVYVSLFPFEVRLDGDTLRSGLERAVLAPIDGEGRRTFPRADLVGNGLLGLPLGVLLAMSGLLRGSPQSRSLQVGVVACGLAGMVEVMQLFTPERTASVVDVGAQAAGALMGAVGAQALLRLTGTSASAAMLRTLRRQPGIGPASVIAGIMAGQSLYPFAATLDARTVWNSFKHGAWIPLQAPRVPAWDVMVVGDLIPGVALGALVVGLCARPSRRARGAAWGLVTAYGVGLELAKLFIEGRSPNANHALAVGVGALLGVAIGPTVGERLRVRAHLGPAFTALAAALLVYHELQPFGFTLATTGVGRIEWLPFTYYYEAEPSVVLVDLGRKVLLGGLLGAALRTWGLGCPAIWTLGFALLLEALQLFLPARYPAVTDVLTLTAGAVIGAALFTRYRALILGRECEAGGTA